MVVWSSRASWRGVAVLGGLGEARGLCCRVDLELVCTRRIDRRYLNDACTTAEAGPVEAPGCAPHVRNYAGAR
jgi:hypothetical protein